MGADDLKQDQDVEAGGQAIQAGRDVVVHSGMSPEQMSKIMIALAGQLSTYFDEARVEQQRRYDALRKDILREFARPDTNANSEAFKDPDFQYVVREAHDEYARTGDDQLKEELVRLIVERSTKSSSSRIARVINSAIEIAGKLSQQEYAALATLFVFQKVVVQRVLPSGTIANIRRLLDSFIDDLPMDNAPLEYLESLGCITINPIVSNLLVSFLPKAYAHPFGPGFTEEQVREAIGADAPADVVFSRTYRETDRSSTFWFINGTHDELRNDLQSVGIKEPALRKLLELRQSTEAPAAHVLDVFRRDLPYMDRLEEFYRISGAQHAIVTIVGRALAHSALKGRGGMRSPLEVWVS